ncbi:hypothetical protein BSKO_02994 [Bryopsis sp. KO-2023]|nr:hypothetical protein BSKO_02994 [Bryopsis sp. KO-2023]
MKAFYGGYVILGSGEMEPEDVGSKMDLPTGVLSHIVSILPGNSVAKCSCVSKKWASICWKDETLWKRLHSRDFGYPMGGVRPEGWRAMYASEWCWRVGRVRCKTLKKTQIGSVYCVEYDGARLLSGMYCNDIVVWDLKTGQCIQTIRGHTGSVHCLQAVGDWIVSGSGDKTIKIWDGRNGVCQRTLSGHSGPVYCIDTADGKIVSGSGDGTIRVWDFASGVCLDVLGGHLESVSCLQFGGGKIVSGSWDGSIKVWDVVEGICIKTLVAHSGPVYTIQCDDDKIVSGSRDGSIRIWSWEALDRCIAPERCVRTLEGNSGFMVYCLKFCGRRLVSGSYNNTILLWDLDSGKCVRVLKGHGFWVRCLQFDGEKIVSGSDDGTIKVWRFGKSA